MQNLSRQELEQTSYHWLLQSAGDWTGNPDKPKGIEWNTACVGRRVNVACSFKAAFKSSFRLQTAAKRTYLHTYILYRLQALHLRLLHGHMQCFLDSGRKSDLPKHRKNVQTQHRKAPPSQWIQTQNLLAVRWKCLGKNCMMWNTRSALIITQFWCGFVYFGPSKTTKLTLHPALSGLI